jgi:hypothetical protein
VTEWESAEERNNREKINRVRQAAEDLFKPKRQTRPTELPTPAPDVAPSVVQQPRRQPRIFTVPPRVPVNATNNARVEPKPIARKTAAKGNTGSISPAQEGRVRALTRYGMTPAQVAELYGVTVDEIDRIVRRPVYRTKSQ